MLLAFSFQASSSLLFYLSKRVFILGPSHKIYLNGCTISKCDEYDTPIGRLPLDKETIEELRGTGEFLDSMSTSVDENEHSIEMQLPYLRKIFQK
jgi:AmmeMemoRadiSam system protein B